MVTVKKSKESDSTWANPNPGYTVSKKRLRFVETSGKKVKEQTSKILQNKAHLSVAAANKIAAKVQQLYNSVDGFDTARTLRDRAFETGRSFAPILSGDVSFRAFSNEFIFGVALHRVNDITEPAFASLARKLHPELGLSHQVVFGREVAHSLYYGLADGFRDLRRY